MNEIMRFIEQKQKKVEHILERKIVGYIANQQILDAIDSLPIDYDHLDFIFSRISYDMRYLDFLGNFPAASAIYVYLDKIIETIKKSTVNDFGNTNFELLIPVATGIKYNLTLLWEKCVASNPELK